MEQTYQQEHLKVDTLLQDCAKKAVGQWKVTKIVSKDTFQRYYVSPCHFCCVVAICVKDLQNVQSNSSSQILQTINISC